MAETVALITGASRGIGKAAAFALWREGYRIVICCRNSMEALLAFADDLNALRPDSVLAVRTDITDRAQVESNVGDTLTVLSHRLALIPTEGEYELLCHEFRCETEDGQHILLYFDAVTGAQKRILLLLEDESGTLVQ